ncbi:hypothetical protein [Serratia sp. DD3]|uniref:hypothetical protein n=1 Tax=Serratia sp. DD3 TaxID=1410619 RepID=UPI0003C521EF|nr:hypothetical protein [Serratia sp. DD3]KEY59862.1 hypothetical protein SRDD_12010 [Serratia sp. DD3]KEY60202.1 hypothetical protein SRDD_08310 [Serratia sp. DD3]
MSVFRHLATATGIIATLFSVYQAQGAMAEQMRKDACSPWAVRVGRIGALFVTSLLMGGLVDALIQRVFPQRG